MLSAVQYLNSRETPTRFIYSMSFLARATYLKSYLKSKLLSFGYFLSPLVQHLSHIPWDIEIPLARNSFYRVGLQWRGREIALKLKFEGREFAHFTLKLDEFKSFLL